MKGRAVIAGGVVLGMAGWLWLLLAGNAFGAATPLYKSEGEMRWALYVTISPAWLDPAQVAVTGFNHFWFGYALHDALVKPMPGNPMAPSLAGSWTQNSRAAKLWPTVPRPDSDGPPHDGPTAATAPTLR